MLRIISGAQTGVDRAALDMALKHHVPCGGWCPQGRMAEDGVIPASYPVKELSDGGYDERTLRNVQQADGTVIIYFGQPSGGTETTLLYCLQHKKPYLLVDARELETSRAAQRIKAFVDALAGGTLNFAGPRASDEPKAYPYASSVIEKFLVLHQGADAACEDAAR
jgi:hypothetical protein